jgi:hypothetical protein
MYANPGTNSYFNSYSSLEPEHAVKVRKCARLVAVDPGIRNRFFPDPRSILLRA